MLSLGICRDGFGVNKFYLLRLAVSDVCLAGHTADDIEHVFWPTWYWVADRYIMFLRVIKRAMKFSSDTG